MSEGITYQKSKQFAVRIVNLYRYLCEDKHEFIMSKQLIRSGTGIGANIAEANCAYSERDFLAKMYIAFKECAETQYWLELLNDTGYLTDNEYESINSNCVELKKLLSSITKTLRDKDS